MPSQRSSYCILANRIQWCIITVTFFFPVVGVSSDVRLSLVWPPYFFARHHHQSDVIRYRLLLISNRTRNTPHFSDISNTVRRSTYKLYCEVRVSYFLMKYLPLTAIKDVAQSSVIVFLLIANDILLIVLGINVSVTFLNSPS